MASPALSEAQWKQSKFVLGTFVDPPFVMPYSSSNSIKDTASLITARAAYFNLLARPGEGGPPEFKDMSYILEIADKTNFKSLINDQRFTDRVFACFNYGYNCPPFDQNSASAVTYDYKQLDLARRRAIYGYRISDEPCDANFGVPICQQNDFGGSIKQWIGHLQHEEPSKLAYVNLLGYTTLSPISRYGYGAYIEHFLNDAGQESSLRVGSYDHYAFNCSVSQYFEGWGKWNADCTSPTFFYNLAIMRSKAGTRPFWVYPMSVDHWSYRDPDANQLRFMVFSPTAYGAKGLIYFTYSRPMQVDDQGVPVYRTALVDDNGIPTSKYYDVQQINHYIRDIVGPVVMNSVHLGAFHKSNKPTEEAIPDDQKITASTSLIADVNNDNILIGLFRDASTYYALVVNKSLSSTPRVVLTLKGDWRNKIELAPSVLSYRAGDTYFSRPTSYNAATNTTRVAIPPLAGGEGRLVKIAAPTIFADLIGDRDNFHSGDVADMARQSPWLIGTLGEIAANGGYLPGVDLDVLGSNRPVGLTHVLPTNAIITSARVRFRLKAIDPLVYNDTILFDDSVSQGPGKPFLPFIALRDLLGREPQQGETLNLEMDLSRVPIRTRDTSGGPGGHLSPNPDEYRNLLPLLADGEFNLIFLDDVAVDYSELRVIYADAQSLVSFEALKSTAPPSTKDTTDCPVEFAGKYSFDALLTNRSGLAFSNLRVGIEELSNENLLLSTDKERLEASEWFEVPATGGYADRNLQSGETVKVPFTVCMKVWQPFRLLVNVAGVAQ